MNDRAEEILKEAFKNVCESEGFDFEKEWNLRRGQLFENKVALEAINIALGESQKRIEQLQMFKCNLENELWELKKKHNDLAIKPDLSHNA